MTFCLTAPQASQVVLQLQSLTQKAPTGMPYPMTKDASGIWSVTVGSFQPNYYGYAFTVDGVQMADPANRNESLYQGPPIWPGPSTAWSWVLVPGPAANYMAEANVPHGLVSTVHYYSRVLKSQEQMLVYTPPGYNHSKRRYPVLYLYPGGGGLDTDWTTSMRANFIMDNLIAQRKAKSMIVAMPEYNVRSCPDFSTDKFPEQLTRDVVRTTAQMFRVLPGGQNGALAGLSNGGGCVLNTMVKDPSAFAYIGGFSAGWDGRTDIEQNHQNLLRSPAINRDVKLLWLTTGGSQDIDPTSVQTFLRKYHIRYTYVPGESYGATYGHVWDTWRKALEHFAPVLFRDTKGAAHRRPEHAHPKHHNATGRGRSVTRLG